jgi:hypothetical protein
VIWSYHSDTADDLNVLGFDVVLTASRPDRFTSGEKEIPTPIKQEAGRALRRPGRFRAQMMIIIIIIIIQ